MIMNNVIDKHNRRSSLTSSSLRRGSIHLVPVLVLLFLLAGCTDYAQEFKDEYGSRGTASSEDISEFDYDCSVTGGVRVLYPERGGGRNFAFGDTITVVYGSDVRGSGYHFVFNVYGEDREVDLLDESAGPTTPDGRSCYTQKVVFDKDFFIEGTGGYIRVVPNEEPSLAGSSGVFKVYSGRSMIENENENESSQTGENTSFPCGDLWCGSIDTEGKVETGSSDNSAGYWYDFNDAFDGGNSIVNFPSDVEENVYGNFFGPLIEQYAGIKGSFVLGDSYDYPYVGLAFDVVKRCKENMFKTQKYKFSCVPQYDSFGNQSNRCPDSLSRQVGSEVFDCELGGDITSWGGLCLVYESTNDFGLELVPEMESVVTKFDNHRVTVSKTSSITTVNFFWSEFKQRNFGEKVDLSYILSLVAAIRLKFEGPAGTTGDFYIRSIGRQGTCN